MNNLWDKLNNHAYKGKYAGIVSDYIKVSKVNCCYCDREILGIWDKHNSNNYWPYLGNQARRPNTYKYSEVVQSMRENDNSKGKVWNNNLVNIHARAHSDPTNWNKRGSRESVRLLCNECFQLTYKRIKVKGDDGITYALSVVESRGETIGSVMNDLKIKGQIIGEGGIRDYD